MKLCRKCSIYYNDDEGFSFCSTCGSKLEDVNICPKCNTTNEMDYAFCIKCGTKLSGNSVEDNVPNNVVSAIQTTQIAAPTQNLPQTNGAIESVPIQPPIQPQINEDTTSEDTSNTNWKIIIGGIIVIAGIILALNSTILKNTIVTTKSYPIDEPVLTQWPCKIMQKGAFVSEEDVHAKISIPSKNLAKAAAGGFFAKPQSFYCTGLIDTYDKKDTPYRITLVYYLPDTITYPQKDVMDFWTIKVASTLINDKVYGLGDYIRCEHMQVNKRTNEQRLILQAVFSNVNNNPNFKYNDLSQQDKEWKPCEYELRKHPNERVKEFFEKY